MEVLFTDDAAADVAAIHAFLTTHDSLAAADHVVSHIEKAAMALRNFPNRGSYPPELLELGNRRYREVFFKPYRIVYRVSEKAVYILLVADGRRDMRTLLQKRLLER
jgi:toxin ParE1/3/4